MHTRSDCGTDCGTERRFSHRAVKGPKGSWSARSRHLASHSPVAESTWPEILTFVHFLGVPPVLLGSLRGSFVGSSLARFDPATWKDSAKSGEQQTVKQRILESVLQGEHRALEWGPHILFDCTFKLYFWFLCQKSKHKPYKTFEAQNLCCIVYHGHVKFTQSMSTVIVFWPTWKC